MAPVLPKLGEALSRGVKAEQDFAMESANLALKKELQQEQLESIRTERKQALGKMKVETISQFLDLNLKQKAGTPFFKSKKKLLQDRAAAMGFELPDLAFDAAQLEEGRAALFKLQTEFNKLSPEVKIELADTASGIFGSDKVDELFLEAGKNLQQFNIQQAGKKDVIATTGAETRKTQKVRLEFELSKFGKEQEAKEEAAGLKRVEKFDADVRGVAKDIVKGEDFKRLGNVSRASKNLFKQLERGGAFQDLATLFDFVKLVDPDSVVRRGEAQEFTATASFPDRVANFFNRAFKGERLNPEQRSELQNFVLGRLQIEVGSYEEFIKSVAPSVGRGLKEFDPGQNITQSARRLIKRGKKEIKATGSIDANIRTLRAIRGRNPQEERQLRQLEAERLRVKTGQGKLRKQQTVQLQKVIDQLEGKIGLSAAEKQRLEQMKDRLRELR